MIGFLHRFTENIGLKIMSNLLRCLVLVGIDKELDAAGRQFEPYPYRRMRLHAGGALVV